MGLRKVLLIIAGATFACLLICAVVFVIGLRAARDSVHDDLAHAISTSVSQRIDANPRSANAMTLTIDADELARQLAAQNGNDGPSTDDIVVYLFAPDQIVIGLHVESRDITYTASLEARDGKLYVTDIDASHSAARFLLPVGKVADGIETGVNDALFAANLELQSLEITQGQLILEVVTGPTTS
jgi:hypothetical protein